MSERFTVSSVNPNDSVGGGGCLCSESKVEDCKPPYVIFHVTETSSNLSPHVVGCANCIQKAAQAVEEGEVLSAGEPSPEPSDEELLAAVEELEGEFSTDTAENPVSVENDGEEAPRV